MTAKFLTNWRFWIGILFSIVCLGLAIRDVPLSDFGTYLAQADYIWILPAIISTLLAGLMRGVRWQVLLNHKVGLADAFWGFSIGNLFNNLLPLRAGDAVRILVVSEKTGVPVAQITSTVVVERLLDIVTILILFTSILPFMNVPAFAIQAGVIFGIAVLMAIIALIIMVRYRATSYRLIETILKRFPFLPQQSILNRGSEVMAGLKPLAQLPILIEAIIFSLLSWIFSVGFYFCILMAFGSQSPLIESIFVVVVISLAISLPSSPGFIGVFHLAGQQALVQPFGDAYTNAQAFGVILVAYITVYIVNSILGGLGLLHFGKRFFALSRQVSQETLTAS